MRPSPLVFAALLLLSACHDQKFPELPHAHYDWDSGPWPQADSGAPDAGTADDAGLRDAAGQDSGASDADTDAASDSGSHDAGGPPACQDRPEFYCGAYAFTYTELHGIDVALGQGYQEPQGDAQLRLGNLRDRDCVRDQAGMNPPSHVTGGQAPDDPHSLLDYIKFTPAADPDPVADAFALYCEPDGPLTRHFYRFEEFGGPTDMFDGRNPVAGAGMDCGNRYVYAVSHQQVTAVAVTFRFPSAEAAAWVDTAGAYQAVLTFATPERQAAADLALAQVGAQVELHVAASGQSHDKLRALLARSSCRGDHLSGCRDVIAQLMNEGQQIAQRGEYDVSAFATTPLLLPTP